MSRNEGRIPVYDNRERRIVAWCATRKSANRTADRRNLQYGAHRYRALYEFEMETILADMPYQSSDDSIIHA